MRVKISPFLADLLTTSITSIVTILSTVFVLRWLALGLGAKEFGAYSLARQLVSTAAPLVNLAMGVALPRYLGLYRGQPQKQYSYLWGATLISIALSFIIILIGLLMRRDLSLLIFHDSKYVLLFLASLLMLFGNTVFSVLYGYYRGTRRMREANLWQLGLMALGPLVVVGILIGKSDASGIVAALGGLFMVATIPLAYFLLKGLSTIHMDSLGSAVRELIHYGAPRTPAGLAFTGMLLMGPFLAPYFGTLEDAGYLVVGQAPFRIVESAVIAFGIVVLPRAAYYVGKGRETELKDNIRDMVTFIIQMGIFIALQLFIWADLIVLAWLGPLYREAIPLMKVTVLALPAYLGYVTLRSIIDAVEVKAVNTLNLIIGLGVGAGVGITLASTGLGVLGLAIGTMVGFLTTGIGSITYLRQRYRFALEMPVRTLAVNAVFFLLAWAAHQWLITRNDLINLVFVLGLESLLFISYFLLLRSWKVKWIQQIRNRWISYD